MVSAMSKDKVCNEMAKDIYAMIRSRAMSMALASLLYDKGWRKTEGADDEQREAD